jgi:hypothetical protein
LIYLAVFARDMILPMPTKRPPRETNVLAKYIVDVTTGDREKIEQPTRNPHAQALGRLGGLKGGKARAETLTARERTLSAKKAANARWKKQP